MNIVRLIERYGLQPVSQRTFPLFSLSCFEEAYTILLHEALGFSYEAAAALGRGNRIHTLFNLQQVADATSAFLRRNGDAEHCLFRPARAICAEARESFRRARAIARRDPARAMALITELYPQYYLGIGIYNCFMRWLQERDQTEEYSRASVQRIARQRNTIAKFYPQVESLAEQCAKALGKRRGIDGRLLLALSLREMRTYLRAGRLPPRPELERRTKNYLYIVLRRRKREIIITDERTLSAIQERFFTVPSGRECTGFPAYGGRARGIVFKPDEGNKRPVGPYVIVASTTHPSMLPVIKASVAIVADEGGVLSHAAVLARELRKPCVIGTRHATRVFKDGDFVEVDAEKGIVRRIRQ